MVREPPRTNSEQGMYGNLPTLYGDLDDESDPIVLGVTLKPTRIHVIQDCTDDDDMKDCLDRDNIKDCIDDDDIKDYIDDDDIKDCLDDDDIKDCIHDDAIKDCLYHDKIHTI